MAPDDYRRYLNLDNGRMSALSLFGRHFSLEIWFSFLAKKSKIGVLYAQTTCLLCPFFGGQMFMHGVFHYNK